MKPFLLRRLKGTAGRGFPKSGDTLFTAPSVTIHWSLHTSQVDCLLIQYTHTRQLKTDALFYPSQGDVESNLPRKKEIVVYAHMVKTQRTYNDALVNKTIGEMLQVRAFPCSKSASLFGPITGDCLRNTHHEKLTPIFFSTQKLSGASQVGGASLNNMLMQLRKNCNHPDLISGGLDGSILFPGPEQVRVVLRVSQIQAHCLRIQDVNHFSRNNRSSSRSAASSSCSTGS